MSNISIDGIITSLEESFMDNGMMFDVSSISQSDVKEEIGFDPMFKMLNSEYTKDSKFTVSSDESKFLNDKFYRNHWIMISYGYRIAFICVDGEGEDILISAIEVSEDCRGEGFGKMIVDGIENYAGNNGFERVVVYPFDTDSKSFWRHIDYEESEFSNRMYKNV